MTTLLAINPNSRSGDAWPDGLEARLESLGPLVHYDFDGDRSLEEQAARYSDVLERIVVGGGDGTIHAALPAARRCDLPLGIIPMGTANDFAGSLGIPDDPDQAVDIIVEGRTKKVDLGEVNGRPFLNAVGVGLGPELTREMDQGRKQRLGVLAYARSFMDVYDDQYALGGTLTLDGESRKLRFMQLTIGNGIRYGGGMTISSDSRLDDGRLTVLCLFPQSIGDLVGNAIALRRGPETGNEPRGIKVFKASTVRIETRSPTEATADGEPIGETPLDCRSIPGALEVFIP